MGGETARDEGRERQNKVFSQIPSGAAYICKGGDCRQVLLPTVLCLSCTAARPEAAVLFLWPFCSHLSGGWLHETCMHATPHTYTLNTPARLTATTATSLIPFLHPALARSGRATCSRPRALAAAQSP